MSAIEWLLLAFLPLLACETSALYIREYRDNSTGGGAQASSGIPDDEINPDPKAANLAVYITFPIILVLMFVLFCGRPIYRRYRARRKQRESSGPGELYIGTTTGSEKVRVVLSNHPDTHFENKEKDEMAAAGIRPPSPVHFQEKHASSRLEDAPVLAYIPTLVPPESRRS